jgi:hypothetical protein
MFINVLFPSTGHSGNGEHGSAWQHSIVTCIKIGLAWAPLGGLGETLLDRSASPNQIWQESTQTHVSVCWDHAPGDAVLMFTPVLYGVAQVGALFIL